MAFIFSTSTYIIGVKLGAEINQTLKDICSRLGLRYAPVENPQEFVPSLDKICYLAGVLCNDKLSEEDDSVFKDYQHKFYSPHSQSEPSTIETITSDNASQLVNQVLSNLECPSLTKLMCQSAEEITATFLPQSQLTFKEVQSEAVMDYDSFIRCETESSPYKGRCELYVNTKLFEEQFPGFLPSEKRIIWDAYKEYANQFLGLINRSFENANFATRIGIPNAFSKEDNENFPTGTLFLPFSKVRERHQIFEIHLGYIHPQKGPSLQHINLEYNVGNHDVVFL